MKILSSLFLIAILAFISCRTLKTTSDTKDQLNSGSESNEEVGHSALDFSEQSTWLLGYFNKNQLTREPYSAWYLKGYDTYIPASEAINKLMDIPYDDLTIKIVLGTWCPDSRREVPRFMRIIDFWHFPQEKITFIGVDNAKLSPVGEYNSLDILRVPTFIFYKNNVEAGRIIENPVTSLEQDMINILLKNEN